MAKKLVIAHRGAPWFAHENTIASFQKAMEIGADIVELDVRKTKDGVLVCFHDADIAGKSLNQITFSELNQLATAQNFTVPTLEEALRLMAGKIQVHIEIKDTGYEQEIADLAKNILKPEEYFIISFNFSSLKNIKLNNPHIQTGLILGASKKRIGQTLKFLWKQKQILPFVDMLALNHKLFTFGAHYFIPPSYRLGVWTVDDPVAIKKFLGHQRVWALTSNKPDLALQIRNQL